MSALNQTETQQLQAVQSLLQNIERHGYVPEDADLEIELTMDHKKMQEQQVKRDRARHIKKLLKEARSAVNTITQMKGYYPS